MYLRPQTFLAPVMEFERKWMENSNYKSRTQICIGSWRFFLNIVCVLHFCVDDLLLLIQHTAICVSEKPKGWNEFCFMFSEQHQFDDFKVARNVTCYGDTLLLWLTVVVKSTPLKTTMAIETHNFSRRYIFKWSFFHCHISFRGVKV